MTKLVIMGASGNLARVKIFPALEEINIKNLEIYLYCRACTEQSFGQYLIENKENYPNLIEKIRLVQGNYDNLESLNNIVDENTIYYLSVPPIVYITILKQLKNFPGGKIAIEKPYGENYEDFKMIDEIINETTHFKFYFIDHFITKPIPSEIRNIYCENYKLRNILNNKFISKSEILVKEKITACGREYFEQTGIIKDMLINHLIEYFVLFFANVSNNYDLDIISLLEKTEIDLKRNIFGQYNTYETEFNKKTDTQTFVCITLNVKNDEWENTPIFIYSGKGLDEKRTEIRFNFKKNVFQDINKLFKLDINYEILQFELIFNIFPDNQIYFKLNGINKIIMYDESNIGNNKIYSNYELIFYSLIKNIEFPYVNSAEIKYFWNIFEPILKMKKENIKYELGYDFKKEINKLIFN